MELKIFTDGGSINNPGPAAAAFAIFQDHRLIYQSSVRIGNRTNNFAEYTALVKALEWTITNKLTTVSRLAFFSDSNLMVNQLNGMFKVKNPTIREFILKIRTLEQGLQIPIVYKYIPREQNQLADSLVKKALGM